MSQLWNGFRDFFIEALRLLHGLFDFVGEEPAWGFAIIALTLIVRVLMLPLAIKQTHSMRAMQQLQPQIKAIQKKYKTDRDLMKKDPERYKAQRQKMNEEMTALYQEAGVNPAGGCLPLLAQAPIFLALFSVLRTPLIDNPNLVRGSALDQLLRSDFYIFTPGCPSDLSVLEEGTRCGLSTAASASGFWGIVLILLMAASMFWSQRQMIAKSTATADGAQMQQQKIMMYVMPVFLAVISYNFPMGVLLYWVTTNIWQIAQQAIILHEVEEHADEDRAAAVPQKPDKKANKKAEKRDQGGAKGAGKAGSKGAAKGGSRSPGKGGAKGPKDASSKPPSGKTDNGKRGSSPTSGNGRSSSGSRANGAKGSSSHLPNRRSRRSRG